MFGTFHFKQFSVDQAGCAMKINTDGVLLGALAGIDEPENILDIGTGTGVIAMMLAQKFKKAQIDAVEIDAEAAKTAGRNFNNSSFAARLGIYPVSFDQFLEQYPDKKYDLIVSNPPFYINSLKSPQANINTAKHADEGFFKRLLLAVSSRLGPRGICWLILPVDTSLMVKEIALNNPLYVKRVISIFSYPQSQPHREILALTLDETKTDDHKFIIYNTEKQYSPEYEALLKDYLTIF